MSFFEWNNTYSVNISIIDEQHKRLISLLNELFEAMQAGKGKELLGKTLDGLVDYTRMHFGTEEKLMVEYDYPEQWRHKKEHNDLTRQVVELQIDYNAGKTQLTVPLSNFLKTWLADHILGTDKRFGAFLITKGLV
jgi:hemerythrin